MPNVETVSVEKYVVPYRRPHYWLMAMSLFAAAYIWASHMPLGVARVCFDVCRHGIPAGLHWSHVKRIHIPMTCAACSCGVSCTCCPHFKLNVEPYQSQDYALAGFLVLSGLVGILALLGRRSSLVLTPQGITFPSETLVPVLWLGSINVGSSCFMPIRTPLFPTKKTSRTRAWTDIAGINLSSGTDEDQEDGLMRSNVDFSFLQRVNLPPYQQALLKLHRLRDRDINTFLNALSLWGDQATMSKELRDLMARVLSEDKIDHQDVQNQSQDLSFTSMWENDLSSHMGATTFVPLAKGAVLQSGRIRVIALLATGGLSAVYLAEQNDGAMVILKESVVPKHIDDKTKEKARELFEREARLLLKLRHQQVARVVDHLVEGGRDYLVLEYIAGQSLRQLVKRTGAQSEELVMKWASHVSEILAYLHGLDPPVVHRDLTPDNLVLKEDGTIALIDFGAANEYVGAATGTLIGKQSYISPEQFRGKASPQSDIYALGCTLHFLLTAEDPTALSVSHPRRQRPDISQDIDSLIAACTALDESSRISTVQELKRRLSELSGGKDSSGTDDSAETPAS